MYEGRTFNIFEFFEIVKSMGGFANVKSWTDLCRKVNMNPSKSNISTRLREWAEKHHIIPFFDFMMDIPHEFYRDLRDDEIVGKIRIEKEGVEGEVEETEDEMWLRLYGLDGGLTTRRRKTVYAPSTPNLTYPIAPSTPGSTTNETPTKRALDDDHQHAHPILIKRRRFEGDRMVVIAGVPHAALSIHEQKILNDVAAKVKSLGAVGGAGGVGVKVEKERQMMATRDLVASVAHPGALIVPSVAGRLDGVRGDLGRLKALVGEMSVVESRSQMVVDAASGDEVEALKLKNSQLSAEVANLLELLKGQQGIVESLRKRVASVEEV
ncbi:hypothetical protein HDU98_005447 [Podochytrium sp. JEL0797]|nr:hypothetical protein HDU98_005447 [Podochytrium sp. JEL0797]